MKNNRTLYDYYVQLGRSVQQKNINSTINRPVSTVNQYKNVTVNQFKDVAVKATSYSKYIDDDFDFQKLNRKDLSKIVQQLSRTVNRRYENLKKQGGISPAFKSLEKSGGKISTKGKDINALRHEYVRAKNFLNLKTSTLKGFNQVNLQLANRLGFSKLSQSQIDRLWEAYNKLDEVHYNDTRKQYGSEQIQQDIINMVVKGSTPDDIVDTLLNQMTQRYEEQQIADNEIIGNPLDLVY